MNYRREIDGLRAVAIVPVVFFHAGFSVFRGGFVGVDVFFVLSGYLITSLIVLEKQQGKFSIVRFYERRIRRIWPALFAMMAICLPVAWMLLYPALLRLFGQAVVAVTFFVSNFLFFFRSGYFDEAAQVNPLLHTWTLAVEEQYYLLFPAFLMLAWRLGKRWLTACVVGVFILSFTFAQLGSTFSTTYPYIKHTVSFVASDFGFFLTPARVWELMIGSLIGLWLPGGFIRYGRYSEVCALAGLAAVLWAALFFSEVSTPFPSFYTLVPTLGTALVILFATPQTLVGRMLSLPLAVGVGLISYSVYLWHQPIFAFARIADPQLPFWAPPLLALASFGAGYLSWKYVETPFRGRSKFDRRQVFRFAAAATCVALVLGVGLVRTDGAIFRFPEKDRYFLRMTNGSNGTYVTWRFAKLDAPFSTADSRPRMLVIGDSFAQDFINMLSENKAFAQYQIRTWYVPARCGLRIEVKKTPECAASSPYTPAATERLHAADLVIVAANWNEGAARAIPSVLQKLGLGGGRKWLIIGTKKVGVIAPLKYVPLTEPERIAWRNHVDTISANAILKSELAPERFVDLETALCGRAGRCPVFTPDGRLLSPDGAHLTPAGARYVGQLLLAQPAIAALNP